MTTAPASIPQASGWSRVGAIFRRDALVALSYPGNFALTWLAIVIEVIVAWYISKLIPPSTPGRKAQRLQKVRSRRC